MRVTRKDIVSLAGKAAVFAKWLFTSGPASAAIDITHRCNLKCLHCYFWREEHQTELSRAEMTALMMRLKTSGIRAAIIYGGEPSLRMELCRDAARIFDACLVFTNGTNGFPLLDGAKWILSLDGPRDINDAIRGRGVYDQALKGIIEAKRPPIVHMTISRLNMHSLEEFVAEITELPIEGIGFSFFTPEKGDFQYALTLDERDRLVDELLSLRTRYGPKVGITRAMARQFRSKGAFGSWNSMLKCSVYRRVKCFGPEGRKKMCTYGDNADCSRCGCAAVAAFRGAFHPINLSTMLLVFGLMGMPGKRLLWPLLDRRNRR